MFCRIPAEKGTQKDEADMIVDFSISNFLSVKDVQVLNFNVETSPKHLPFNYSDYEDGKLRVMRTAAVFGANASGKSNLLKAFRALQWLVSESGDLREGQEIPAYEPYLLSNVSATGPVTFDVEFIVPSGVRFRYTISFTQKRILTESLRAFSRRREALVFQRDETDTWETIKFGSTYTGGIKKHAFFRNNSYLSKAGNTASAPKLIREVFNYFQSQIFIEPNYSTMVPRFLKNEGTRHAVSSLIALADTGIDKITDEENKSAGKFNFPDDLPEEIKEAIPEQNRLKFWHRAEDGSSIPFERNMESDGTIRLFELLPVILRILSRGEVLIVDELDAHLHPHLIKAVLDLFHDDEVNSDGAQLIFSTHDTSVLSQEHMRREQIWFTEKNRGMTEVVCLDEFDKQQVRHNSPFYSFYNDGRLGAVPQIDHSKIRDSILLYKKTTMGGAENA